MNQSNLNVNQADLSYNWDDLNVFFCGDTDTKQADFDHMMTEMKSILHYAEDAVHDDDALLSELGWGGRVKKIDCGS